MQKANFIIPALLLLLLVLSCGNGKSETRFIKSGRLEFVEHLSFGPAGTHGSEGWYIDGRELNTNGNAFNPPELDLKTTTCEASPSKAVEALKCTSFKDGKNLVCIVRMKGDSPELVTISKNDANFRFTDGLWADEGRWLIFRDYLFNVETSEKREAKGLPDDPDKYFITASPDLEMIVYRDACFDHAFDTNGRRILTEPEREEQCKNFDRRTKKGLAAFWVIEAQTGEVKIVELNIKDYPFAQNDDDYISPAWKMNFLDKTVWIKGKSGKYSLEAQKQ